MRRTPRTRSAGLTLRSCSLCATWRAMRSVPLVHFPLMLPGVHPLASFCILWRLKGLGYSDCRVVTTDTGLVVHAVR